MCLGQTVACTIQKSSDALHCRTIPLVVRYLRIFISTCGIRAPSLSDCPNSPCRDLNFDFCNAISKYVSYYYLLVATETGNTYGFQVEGSQQVDAFWSSFLNTFLWKNPQISYPSWQSVLKSLHSLFERFVYLVKYFLKLKMKRMEEKSIFFLIMSFFVAENISVSFDYCQQTSSNQLKVVSLITK